jgi:anti-sigma factor ChrR (cupin superfamily)
MGIGCPDPSLLVAYLDGTLFHRDATAIDVHVETCVNCSTLLAQMRRVREGEERSKRSRAIVVAGAIALVLIAAVGTWFALRPSSQGAASQAAAVRNEANTVPPAPPAPAAPAEVRLPSTALGAGKPDPTSKGEPERPVRLKADTTTEARVEKPAPTKEVPVIEGDVVLRGRDRRIVWRTRDRAIEHSIDGGVTWTLEHTADHPIRAGALVDANVAWLAGENGLVLRRTKNGWFGTSAPAEGAITAVRASSPSKATVTLDDGRVFRTENGGVTWSAQ